MTVAEVISIGDELTSGQRLDTNSQWFSQQLSDLGIQVMYHTTVADDLAANQAVFRAAVERADVVVTSGGLGPTADDLTRDVMASLLGTELVLHEESLEHIRGLFRHRGREMPERNVIQAMFPAGSQPIFNPHGTAPGIAAQVARADGRTCLVYCLPGVPAELKEMWAAVVASLREAGLVGKAICHREIRCFGVGESDLEQMLPDLIRRGRRPTVGITASHATLTLRVMAACENSGDCDCVIGPTVNTIYQCLGDLVFGEGEEELQHAVLRLLRQSGKTLATAEWGTGGQIAHWLRQVPESEQQFLGGLVIPGPDAADKLLGIPADVFTNEPPGEAMAKLAAGLRDKLGSDYALAVSPVPSVDPAGDEPPLIHFALAGSSGTRTQAAKYTAHPDILQTRASKQALNLLRLELLRSQ